MIRKNLGTDQGVPVSDNQNSLTIGQPDPDFLQDVHQIEKKETMLRLTKASAR